MPNIEIHREETPVSVLMRDKYTKAELISAWSPQFRRTVGQAMLCDAARYSFCRVLASCGVMPELWRQGIGKTLIELAQLSACIERPQIVAVIPEINVRAQLFLKACGFKAHGMLDDNIVFDWWLSSSIPLEDATVGDSLMIYRKGLGSLTGRLLSVEHCDGKPVQACVLTKRIGEPIRGATKRRDDITVLDACQIVRIYRISAAGVNSDRKGGTDAPATSNR